MTPALSCSCVFKIFLPLKKKRKKEKKHILQNRTVCVMGRLLRNTVRGGGSPRRKAGHGLGKKTNEKNNYTVFST